MTNEKIICTGIKSKAAISIISIITAVSFIISVIGLLLLLDEHSKFPRTDLVGSGYFWIAAVGFVVAVGFLIILFAISRSEITVTDKRVYGKAAFGKRVDLPVHQVSSVSLGMFSAVSVATSSGKVGFLAISNRDEVFDAITDLLAKRQEETKTSVVKAENTSSNADELKKYKELLDSGVITQEEFDEKKKQLLGL